jgi:hypothetical protein
VGLGQLGIVGEINVAQVTDLLEVGALDAADDALGLAPGAFVVE